MHPFRRAEAATMRAKLEMLDEALDSRDAHVVHPPPPSSMPDRAQLLRNLDVDDGLKVKAKKTVSDALTGGLAGVVSPAGHRGMASRGVLYGTGTATAGARDRAALHEKRRRETLAKVMADRDLRSVLEAKDKARETHNAAADAVEAATRAVEAVDKTLDRQMTDIFNEAIGDESSLRSPLRLRASKINVHEDPAGDTAAHRETEATTSWHDSHGTSFRVSGDKFTAATNVQGAAVHATSASAAAKARGGHRGGGSASDAEHVPGADELMREVLHLESLLKKSKAKLVRQCNFIMASDAFSGDTKGNKGGIADVVKLLHAAAKASAAEASTTDEALDVASANASKANKVLDSGRMWGM